MPPRSFWGLTAPPSEQASNPVKHEVKSVTFIRWVSCIAIPPFGKNEPK